jgi:hypothetical protein
MKKNIPYRFINCLDPIHYLGKSVVVSRVELPDIKGVLTGIKLVRDGELIISSLLEIDGDYYNFWNCRPESITEQVKPNSTKFKKMEFSSYLRGKITIMATFIQKMMSGSPEVSSKRVIGVISFITVLIISFKIVFSKEVLPNETLIKEVLYTLFLIIAATVLGGTVENIMKRPSQVVNPEGSDTPSETDKKKGKKKDEEIDENDLS